MRARLSGAAGAAGFSWGAGGARAEYAFRINVMARWLTAVSCAIVGLALVGLGLLVPAHLRAVDAHVLKVAGRQTSSLLQLGVALVRERQLGAAQMLAQAAQELAFPDRDLLQSAVDELKARELKLVAWGLPDMRVDTVFWADTRLSNSVPQPVTEVVLRLENRGKLLSYLKASSSYEMQDLLVTRALTNTTVLPPSGSSSGQAFDAAVSVAGLLMDSGQLHPALREALAAAAREAVRSGNSEPCEQALLDLLLLGRRFNYGQLVQFVSRIETLQGLRTLTHAVTQAEERLPRIFAAVVLSERPAAVGQYLMDFSQSGPGDVDASLRYQAGGVRELVESRRKLHAPAWRAQLARTRPFDSIITEASEYALHLPWVALGGKWLCFLSGGFLLALGFHHVQRPAGALELPLQVRGFHLAREGLFALGFLVFVLLVSEPFLAQDTQKAELPFRIRLPMVTEGAAALAVKTSTNSSLMNQLSLLTLLLFFVLQALIYTACLLKLAEIRRQNIASRIKLKLLDNEDHLFDAGLYLGFVGTIISLILVSLGVIKPSLMAAYSSTSFGIIFVSIFKIFHLRPLRRKLLLEAEAGYETQLEPEAANPFTSAT